MKQQRLFVLGAIAVLSMTMWPRATAAQPQFPPAPVDAAATERNIARAQQLEAKAREMVEASTGSIKFSRFASIARKYRKAASLRPEGDPVVLTDLEEAGRYFYYGNDRSAAILSLRELAERAIAFGEVNRAAHAYLDAAFVAVEDRNPEAISFVRAAERLASSTHLTEQQRVAVLNRIAPSRLAVGGARD